jgi:hypothetical protein
VSFAGVKPFPRAAMQCVLLSMRIFLRLILLTVFFASCGHTAGKYRASAKQHDKYGYIDETGSFVIDPEFDVVWSFVRGTAVVKNNGQYGLIDKMGDWVVEPSYDSVIPFSADCFIVMQDSVFGFMQHGTGKMIIAPQYEQVYYYTDELCVVQKGRALGIVNSQGILVCPPQLQDLKEMFGPLAIVVQSDTSDEMSMLLSIIDGGAVKSGLINSKGQFVTPCKYDEIFDDVNSGYYYPFVRADEYRNDSVVNDVPVMIGTYGIIDTTGRIVTEPMFEEMPVYGDGMFRVRMHGKYGFADTTGKVVISASWEYAVAFSEGKAIVSDNSNSSIIDKSGKVIASDLGPGTGMYRFFSNRARCRSLDGMYGYMNSKGARVIPPAYDAADDFSEGVAIVSKEGFYGLIDTNGKFIINPEYSFLYNLGDGLYKVQDREGKTGVMNSAGQQIVAREYDDIFHLQKNYLMVEKDYLNGCFDINGHEIFPATSPTQLYFVHGKCIVSDGIKSGMIDTLGHFFIPAEYDSIGYFLDGYTIVTKNGVYGAIDSTGKVVANAKYTTLLPFVNGYAVFRLKGKFGYLNTRGEEVIEAKFDDAGVLVDPDRRDFR